jgi:hypothetical protein
MPLADNFGRQAEALPIRELLGPTTKYAIDGDNEFFVVERTGATTDIGRIKAINSLYFPVNITTPISGTLNATTPAENVSGTTLTNPVRTYQFDREFIIECVYVTSWSNSSGSATGFDIHKRQTGTDTTNSIFNNGTTVTSAFTLGASVVSTSTGSSSFNGSGTVTLPTTHMLCLYLVTNPGTAVPGIEVHIRGYMKDTV